MENRIRTIDCKGPRIKIFAFTRPIAGSGNHESSWFEAYKEPPFARLSRLEDSETVILERKLVNAIFAVGGVEKVTTRIYETGVTFASAFNLKAQIKKVRQAIVKCLFGDQPVVIDDNEHTITWFEGTSSTQRIYSVSSLIGPVGAVMTFAEKEQRLPFPPPLFERLMPYEVAAALHLLAPIKSVAIAGGEVGVDISDPQLWKAAHDYIVATIKRIRFAGESVMVRRGVEKPATAK